jgi:hypothetical protein
VLGALAAAEEAQQGQTAGGEQGEAPRLRNEAGVAVDRVGVHLSVEPGPVDGCGREGNLLVFLETTLQIGLVMSSV